MGDDTVPEPDSLTLFQVSSLHATIKELEQKYAAVLKENGELRAMLEGGRAEQADIYYYLQKRLDDNYNIMSELETQIITEQTDRERAEAAYENKIKDLEATLAQTKERLEEKVAQLEERLGVLKEFKDRKDEIEHEVAVKLQEAEAEKQRAKSLVEEKERKCIRDKESLRKEMLDKIHETKTNLLATAQDKLDEVTKRTIMDNEQLKLELKYQSRETERVIELNKKLLAESQELRSMLNLARHTEAEMMRMLSRYGRLLRHTNQDPDGEESVQDSVSMVSGPTAPASAPLLPSIGVQSSSEHRASTVGSKTSAGHDGVHGGFGTDDMSMISLGTMFLPRTRVGIMTRSIGVQACAPPAEEAVLQLGSSSFKGKRTYPASWTGATTQRTSKTSASGSSNNSSRKSRKKRDRGGSTVTAAVSAPCSILGTDDSSLDSGSVSCSYTSSKATRHPKWNVEGSGKEDRGGWPRPGVKNLKGKKIRLQPPEVARLTVNVLAPVR